MQGKQGWESEFTALVQQVVQQDAGWAWDGFWRMVLHNLQHPSCDVCHSLFLHQAHLRPSLLNVRACVRRLLVQYAQRPEATLLAPSTSSTVEQVRAWLDD